VYNLFLNLTIEMLNNSVKQLFIFSVLAGLVFIAVVAAGIAIATKISTRGELLPALTLLSVAVGTNTSVSTAIEELLRGVLSSPDTAVKSFAVAAVQFLIGIAFGYLAARALKYILALIGLTLLLSYITSLASPVPIDINALVQAAKALLPLFTLSTGPFLAGVIVGGVIGLLKK